MEVERSDRGAEPRVLTLQVHCRGCAPPVIEREREYLLHVPRSMFHEQSSTFLCQRSVSTGGNRAISEAPEVYLLFSPPPLQVSQSFTLSPKVNPLVETWRRREKKEVLQLNSLPVDRFCFQANPGRLGGSKDPQGNSPGIAWAVALAGGVSGGMSPGNPSGSPTVKPSNSVTTKVTH